MSANQAQEGVNNNNKGEKQKDKSLRYPLARIEKNGSDYLRIQILEFEAPEINLSGLFGDNVSLGEDKKSGTGQFKNLVAKDANFDLPTISQSIDNASKDKKKIKHTILLPIPEQITDATQIGWGEGTLNPAEAFGIQFGNTFIKDSPRAALEGAIRALTSGASSVINDPKTRTAITNALSATAVGALGGNVSANQLISRATGQVFNPNLELLFDGVGLRNFGFNFEFFPRNKKEAEQVIKIIRTMKKAMSAKKTASGNSSVKGIFIGAPDIFKLTYMKGNKPHPFLNSFKPMALVDMQMNYTGSNTYSTFYDGMPTHLTMSLAFKELNPIYADDYDENIDPDFIGPPGPDSMAGGVGY